MLMLLGLWVSFGGRGSSGVGTGIVKQGVLVWGSRLERLGAYWYPGCGYDGEVGGGEDEVACFFGCVEAAGDEG